MLGRVRRTTRADVGLALAFAGIAYLIWTAVMAAARHVVNGLAKTAHIDKTGFGSYPTATRWLCSSFIHGSAIWDLVGVLWLLITLVLIVGSSRQRWIISVPWVSAICQAMAAALIGVWAAVAAIVPFDYLITYTEPPYPTAGWTGLCIALGAAAVMWVLALVWMLFERIRLRRFPSLRDGQRTHIPG